MCRAVRLLHIVHQNSKDLNTKLETPQTIFRASDAIKVVKQDESDGKTLKKIFALFLCINDQCIVRPAESW